MLKSKFEKKYILKFSHCEAQLLRVLKNCLLPSLNSSCHMKLYHFNAGLYLGTSLLARANLNGFAIIHWQKPSFCEFELYSVQKVVERTLLGRKVLLVSLGSPVIKGKFAQKST